MLRKLQEEKPLRSILGGIGAAPFETRAAAALGISVVADALDYVVAPVFALPVIGDIADVFVSGILYSITKSKKAAAINAIEFIPVIGDFIPAYTISTLLWIRQESSKRKKIQKMSKEEERSTAIDHEKVTLAKSINKIAIHSRNKAENSHDDYPDPRSRRRISEGEEEKEMKKLVASRYARWKEGKYQ